MTTRPTIDVSRLPADARDFTAPAWWGNALFMAIETTTVALLLASYFYLWRNFPGAQWPPPQANTDPPILEPVPDLLYGTPNVILMLVTLPLTAWLDRASRRRFDELERLKAAEPKEVPEPGRPEEKPLPFLAGLLAMALLIGLTIALRWQEFPALLVRWNENAYGALVWSLLGLHLLYLVVEVVEFTVMFVWGVGYGFSQNLATDVILTAAYWYWTVAAGVVIYAVVYWFPRVA